MGQKIVFKIVEINVKKKYAEASLTMAPVGVDDIFIEFDIGEKFNKNEKGEIVLTVDNLKMLIKQSTYALYYNEEE